MASRDQTTAVSRYKKYKLVWRARRLHKEWLPFLIKSYDVAALARLRWTRPISLPTEKASQNARPWRTKFGRWNVSADFDGSAMTRNKYIQDNSRSISWTRCSGRLEGNVLSKCVGVSTGFHFLAARSTARVLNWSPMIWKVLPWTCTAKTEYSLGIPRILSVYIIVKHLTDHFIASSDDFKHISRFLKYDSWLTHECGTCRLSNCIFVNKRIENATCKMSTMEISFEQLLCHVQMGCFWCALSWEQF